MPHTRASYLDRATNQGKRFNHKMLGLNRYTQGLTACAWPNCNKSTPESFAATRVGVLCPDHAWSHYDAMNDYITNSETFYPRHLVELQRRQENLPSYAPDEFDRPKRAREEEDEEAKNWGWVYYLQVGERIKIGFSGDVNRRLRAYPPGSELLAVEFGHKKLERQRHLQFAEWLAAGREWFDPSDQLLKHTRDLVDLHGDPGSYAHNYRELRRPQDARQAMKYVRSNKYR